MKSIIAILVLAALLCLAIPARSRQPRPGAISFQAAGAPEPVWPGEDEERTC